MPRICENWSSLAYGTTFYPTLEKSLGNLSFVLLAATTGIAFAFFSSGY